MDKPTAIVVGVGAEQGVGGAVCRRFAFAASPSRIAHGSASIRTHWNST
jgi:hypothetical protein